MSPTNRSGLSNSNREALAVPIPIQSQLAGDERAVGLVSLDIDRSRFFANSHLVLTNKNLWFCDETGAPPTCWPLQTHQALRSTVFSGLGSLTLLDQNQALVTWYFTAAKAAEVERFVVAANAAIHSQKRSQAIVGNPNPPTYCPSCGSLLDGDYPICTHCNPTAAPAPTKSLLRLTEFTRNRLGIVLLGLSLTLMATVAGLIPPYLTMPLLDNVLIPWQNEKEQASFEKLSPYLLGLFGAAFLAWLLGWARTYVMSRISEQISGDLRNKTYQHLQHMSLEFYGARRTGDLISRIGSDSDRICNFLSGHLLDFINDVLMIALTSVILFKLDPWLALVTLIPFPFIAWLIQKVRIRLRHGFARAGHAWSEMVSVLTDAIPGVRVVKAFAQETREIERFADANRHVLESNLRVNRLWSFFGPTVTLLTEVGLLVIWAVGAYQVSRQSITVGELTAFIAYIGRFYVRLDSMSRMLANTQRAAAAAFRVFEILDHKPSVMEPVKPIDPGRVQGGLELRGVRFRYGNREVISGVDLKIAPGELVGLVGPSGSGKSTLVNLVCRFYDVTEGAILVDGTDIRSFPIEKFRSNIGIVLQEPYLFFGTIAENIAYGRPNAKPEQIIAAARAANAHSFISRLPDGYDSVVGERGQGLSGGERQRISIARAILTDPRLLILDEATSAVDNETEREIQAALDNLVKGRTTIAIAHRLSTLRNADRIVVMEHGVVAEVGRHDDLLERQGVYARLHQAQLAVTAGH